MTDGPNSAASHDAENEPRGALPPRFKSEAEYAAALAKFGPCRYDEAVIAEHDADVARIMYHDPDSPVVSATDPGQS